MTDSPRSDLEFVVFDTDWGWLNVVRSPRGLVSLSFPRTTADEAMAELGSVAKTGRQVADFGGFKKKLRDYFAGKRTVFDEALDLTAATPFRRKVWLATQGIPYGEGQSYAWVADRLGNPKACRAVGQALGKNPLPIIVPCHRVLTSDGALGGFSGGLETKRRLLRLEGIACLNL